LFASSQEELLAVDAIFGLVDEFELAVLLVERAQLQRVQLQGEPRSHFLQVSARTVLVELVPMVSEEDEISLVVHGYDSSSFQVGHLREQRCHHAANSVTEHRVEVVQNQFWLRVTWGSAVVHNLVSQLEPGHAERGRGSLWQVTEDQGVGLAVLLVEQQQVGEAALLSPLNHVFNLVVLPFVVFAAGNSALNLFQEIKHGLWTHIINYQ